MHFLVFPKIIFKNGGFGGLTLMSCVELQFSQTSNKRHFLLVRDEKFNFLLIIIFSKTLEMICRLMGLYITEVNPENPPQFSNNFHNFGTHQKIEF